MGPISGSASLRPEQQWRRWGAAHPGCHHLVLTSIRGEYLFFTLFGPCCHSDRKPTDFAVKTFFLIFTNFWTKKRCHHEIPPRVPPSLAAPLLSNTAALEETSQRWRAVGNSVSRFDLLFRKCFEFLFGVV